MISIWQQNLLDKMIKTLENSDYNFKTIDCSRFRKILGISSSNRTMINFLWRNLEILEERKIIKEIQSSRHTSRKYKIIKKNI